MTASSSNYECRDGVCYLRPAEEKPKLVTITVEGTTYDVTNFKHPGGSIILFLAGTKDKRIDATNAFKEFHFRNLEKVSKYLKALPVVETTSEVPVESSKYEAFSKDFQLLRKELEDKGFFDPSPAHIAYRIFELVALFWISFIMFKNAFSFPVLYYCALFINGIAQGRCGWLMHEAGHFSLTGRPKLDTRLQEVIYGLGCGMSGGWWRNQHNKHHATPQKLKHDVDLETLPLVAFNSQVREKVRPDSLLGKWLSIQAYVFAPFSCVLVGFFWTFYLHPRHIIVRTKNPVEITAIALRYILWFYILTSFGYDVGAAAIAYFFSFAVGCTYIFLNFAVSHTHLPVTQPDEYLHWIEYAGLHTTNVSTESAFVTWWMSYLNFQIEHHLFPSMPQYRHPEVSQSVRKLFMKHGLQYDERTYIQAMKDTFANLNQVGNSHQEQKKH